MQVTADPGDPNLGSEAQSNKTVVSMFSRTTEGREYGE